MPKISNLPASGGALTTDQVPIVQSSTTKKQTWSQVITLFANNDYRILPGVANLGALKAINTTGITDNAIIECKTLGVFRFDSSSSAVANDDTIVQPTTGSGRWFRQTDVQMPNNTGLVARTGAGTSAARTLQAGSSKVTIANPDGVSGNPSIDIVTANIQLGSIGQVTNAIGYSSLTASGSTLLLTNPLKTRYDIDYSNAVNGKVILPTLDSAFQPVGYGFVIYNSGVEVFSIYYSDTTTLAVSNIMPGRAVLCVVTNIATPNGAITSSNLSYVPNINNQNANNCLLSPTDYEGIINFSPSAAGTVTLPQTSNRVVPAGYGTLIFDNTSSYNSTFTLEGSDTLIGDQILAPTTMGMAYKILNGSPNTWFTTRLGNKPPTIVITSNTSLSNLHDGCVIISDSSSPLTITIDGSVDFRRSYRCEIININNSTVTITGTNGATLNGSSSFTLPTQNAISIYGYLSSVFYTESISNNLINSITSVLSSNTTFLTGRNTITGTSYTAARATDAFSLNDTTNGSAVAITVNDSSFNTNDEAFYMQNGAGQVTFTAGAGVSFLTYPSGTNKIAGQNGTCYLKKIATNTYLLKGDLTS